MKRFSLIITKILIAVITTTAQTSQEYDFSVGGERVQLNPQLKGIEKFKKADTQGKLVKSFTKWFKPNKDKETIYVGPFNPKVISGKQDYFTTYHYDARTKTVLGVPRGVYIKYITDFFNAGDYGMKILAYSKPISQLLNFNSNKTTIDRVYKGNKEEEKIKFTQKIIDENKKRLSKNGTRAIPDIYFWVYDVFFLPRNEYELEKKRLYELGLVEAKTLQIQHLEDALYYNYYYGQGNPNNYEYSETIIKSGYTKMKNIEEKVAYVNLFNYSNYAKTMQKEILSSSNDFDILIYAYRAIRSNDLASEMEKKLSGLASDIRQIRLFMETFPNSTYKNVIDEKTYKICSGKNRDPYTYLALFPKGKYVKEANETIEKIKEEIRLEQERIKKERIAKIAKEGPNGVYQKSYRNTFGLLWGSYTVYHVEFNDSTKGSFFKQSDGRYCLEAGFFGTGAVYYATETDVTNALYIYRKTKTFTSEGRTGDTHSEYIANQNRADVMPVPSYTIKGWKNNNNVMESEVIVDGESIGTICYDVDSKEYYIWGWIFDTEYDSEANTVRALYAYNKLGVYSTVGQL